MFQQNLFEEAQGPQSIQLVTDFITEAEESGYLDLFRTIQWQKVEMHGVVAKRRVAHFGLDYTYTKRSVNQTLPAPIGMQSLTERAAKLIHRQAEDIKEILVSYYPEGAGIGWHRDAEVFGDAIVGVSFLSDCTMKFKNPESSEVFKLFIPRRSAYVLSGDARWKWKHSITRHEEDRYSVTFRTLRSNG
jgi:alkylated DNA repair dioxygenase AlkB